MHVQVHQPRNDGFPGHIDNVGALWNRSRVPGADTRDAAVTNQDYGIRHWCGTGPVYDVSADQRQSARFNDRRRIFGATRKTRH